MPQQIEEHVYMGHPEISESIPSPGAGKRIKIKSILISSNVLATNCAITFSSGVDIVLGPLFWKNPQTKILSGFLCKPNESLGIEINIGGEGGMITTVLGYEILG